MAESKKLLVAFDPKRPERQSSDFVVPLHDETGCVEFYGTRSQKHHRYAMVILTSRAITENDLFAKVVDAGRKIRSVDETLALLIEFLETMKTVKIGNVVELDGDGDGLKLAVVAKSPSGFKG